MQQKDTTLQNAPELYDIQMLESIGVQKGKELFCTELDLTLEEIESMNACARIIGLIPQDSSLIDMQIKAIHTEEKFVLGFVSHISQVSNSEQSNLNLPKEIVFCIKKGCKENNTELKDFTLTRQCYDGRNRTDWLSTGIVNNQFEVTYLLLLHNILLSHGILRDNPEFLAQMLAKEKELKETQARENDDAEQQQLESDLENFENYVTNNGNIHIKEEDTVITAEKQGDEFIIKCLEADKIIFEFKHQSTKNGEGENMLNSYTLKFKGRELWNPKGMIKIAKYSNEIFGNTLELIKQRITQ